MDFDEVVLMDKVRKQCKSEDLPLLNTKYHWQPSGSSSSTNIFDDLPALSAPKTSELRDELDRYLSTDPEQVTNICKWWYEKRVMYPRLHRMALDYLTIPGMQVKLNATQPLLTKLATSVDVERVFSQGRIVLSHLRSRLQVQSTRALMCLGIWSRLGYVKDSDIKAVVVLPGIPSNTKEDIPSIGWDSIVDIE